jgi:hypothetical protein
MQELFRQSERTPSNVAAAIRTEDDSFKIGCVVRNLSEGGAKLVVDDPNGLPNDFILYLRPDSPIGRRCHVMWHIENLVGVRFVSVFDSEKVTPKGSGVWAPS